VKGKSSASARMSRFADRLAAFAARRSRPAAGFVSQPEPRSIGVLARGKQIMAGNILLAGHLAEAPDTEIWTIAAPDPAFQREAQGFVWLDDLAALGTPSARARAQDWTWGWIDRHGAGKGPGWLPDLTGRRIIRWVHHATLLLNGRDPAQTKALYQSLAQQSAFLARRWKAAAPGLPRFEALTGLVYAGISLIGMDAVVAPACAALAAECEAEIDDEGGLPTRNPEELLDVLTLLTWAASALSEASHPVPVELSSAIVRIAPALRALRHSDGDLCRFHGGDRGTLGRLDQALAAAGVRPAAASSIAMGYARLSGRRTSVIVDASDPPGGRAAMTAHASTTAFELTSGRRPLIVSCGSGAPFGAAWRKAGRATPSHSLLSMDGASSSRFRGSGSEELSPRAAITGSRLTIGVDGSEIYLAHDGWLASHGLTASRTLALSQDGRRLTGVDALTALSADARHRFDDMMTTTRMEGAGFSIRFHLHPDVDAMLDMAGTAVSLALRSGEIWVLRHSGPAELSLQPSVYLEKGRLKPRPATQIVLTAKARGFETRIGWTLAKAQDTPLAIRDLEGNDPDGQA
jgi:uncharacterized heparinase superfamily protein